MLKTFAYIFTFIAGMAFAGAVTQNPFHWYSFAVCVIMMLLCLKNRDAVEFEKGEKDEDPQASKGPKEFYIDEYYNEIPLP